VLTAEEVMGLDLTDAELVTLSACDSGLGAVVGGEGVMGLRRAFAVSGARALLISLWKVPDQDTRSLMEAFYREITSGKTTDKAQALRKAQLQIIRRQRDQTGQSLPLGWAAFILSGR
jgi:CHAT domain-containing protein